MGNFFHNSVISKQILEMIYMDIQGQLTQRIIRVVREEEERILAFCYTRRQVRSFKKENILSIYPYRQQKRMEA
ncbi:hypothetical protein [Alkalibacillus aidingensis]|uniref:hypothetical protein n=1 Tax=Alkalibacillus aidingensis TaxID=2747607 RepID=UPI0016610A49|nr:hypothetical protein [Alkalibacillus aidingensis]